MDREPENILVRREGRVAVITLNRPQAYNALNGPLMAELVDALHGFDSDPEIGCVVITGSEKVFAGGADIKQMAGAGVLDMLESPFIAAWATIAQSRLPLVAAVSGWCLGGGCELAMACDLIIASETAKFGQPELNLGVIPGAGGTQRLTRAVGKAIAMDMILSDRRLTADEALRFGLASRVAPVESYLELALQVAASIASRAPLAVRAAKEAINLAFEGSLAQGVQAERRLFAMLFATEDQKEGMAAFIEKRPPSWQGR